MDKKFDKAREKEWAIGSITKYFNYDLSELEKKSIDELEFLFIELHAKVDWDLLEDKHVLKEKTHIDLSIFFRDNPGYGYNNNKIIEIRNIDHLKETIEYLQEVGGKDMEITDYNNGKDYYFSRIRKWTDINLIDFERMREIYEKD